MKRHCLTLLVFALAGVVQASWYWPFGSDSDAEEEVPRVSELMERATELIDIASDLAADGNYEESVATNRAVLAELDRIERENPERAKSAEFSTLRNKRAYVKAAIDTALMRQVVQNEKPVALSDTAKLERELEAERKAKEEAKAGGEAKAKVKEEAKAKAGDEAKAKAGEEAKEGQKPKTKREQAMADIASGDFAAAKILIDEMLKTRPNDVLALNLKATMEARQGDLKAAEATLDRAILNHPKQHHAYYNMAILMLQVNPDNRDIPRRYYETGRSVGGPKDEKLEALIK